MAFSGRIYWGDDSAETYNFWDSATGAIKTITRYDTAYPDTAGVSGGLGCGMLLGDGRIGIRVNENYTDPRATLLMIDADLTPSASSVMRLPASPVEDYMEARYTSGVYEPTSGLNWLYWYAAKASASDGQASWLAFDNTGAQVETAAVFPYGASVGEPWGTAAYASNGVLYRGLQSNTAILDRFNISSGAWERAHPQIPTGVTGGFTFVGFTANGDPVFFDYTSTDTKYNMRIYAAADMVWSNWFDSVWPDTTAAPTSLVSVVPSDGTHTMSNTYLDITDGQCFYLLDGHAYYSTAGLNYGSGDTSLYGNAFDFWDLDLSTGQTTLVFSNPYEFINADGSRSADYSYQDTAYTRTSNYAMGIVMVPPAAPVMAGELKDARRHFLRRPW